MEPDGWPGAPDGGSGEAPRRRWRNEKRNFRQKPAGGCRPCRQGMFPQTPSQVKVIRELADKEACVIVGRCADYILKERPDCINVFIHANLDFRIKHLTQQNNITEEEARKHIISKDKARAYHYQYYTDKKWGNSKNYHLCLDSGVLGIEKCVSIIESIYLG